MPPIGAVLLGKRRKASSGKFHTPDLPNTPSPNHSRRRTKRKKGMPDLFASRIICPASRSILSLASQNFPATFDPTSSAKEFAYFTVPSLRSTNRENEKNQSCFLSANPESMCWRRYSKRDKPVKTRKVLVSVLVLPKPTCEAILEIVWFVFVNSIFARSIQGVTDEDHLAAI